MPTFRHGRNTGFAILDASSAYRDMSTALREVNFPITLGTADTTAFGSAVRTFVVGIKNGTFSVSGMFDATNDGYFQGIYGLAGAPGQGFIYGPEGTATGLVRYSGTAILTDYEVKGGVDAMVAISAKFQVTGAIARVASAASVWGTGTFTS